MSIPTELPRQRLFPRNMLLRNTMKVHFKFIMNNPFRVNLVNTCKNPMHLFLLNNQLRNDESSINDHWRTDDNSWIDSVQDNTIQKCKKGWGLGQISSIIYSWISELISISMDSLNKWRQRLKYRRRLTRNRMKVKKKEEKLKVWRGSEEKRIRSNFRDDNRGNPRDDWSSSSLFLSSWLSSSSSSDVIPFTSRRWIPSTRMG